VAKNQLLFQLRTKEAAALQRDSTRLLNISGNIQMKATISGVIAAIEHPQGDFVQEGDALAIVVVPGSLVFVLEIPYELKALIREGRTYKLTLPDHTRLTASVRSVLPSMSGASQTQRIVLQPAENLDIPENLLAKVQLIQSEKPSAVILPKSCILSDEIMKNFWVLKLINDSVAVKVLITTGITDTDSVEVISPLLKTTDRILSGGNYGLGDTTAVRIIKNN
jgi:multidrug efflux pump subunit AcrA (membrane-fusion protein)